jgi:hypothetical protein
MGSDDGKGDWCVMFLPPMDLVYFQREKKRESAGTRTAKC